MDLLHKPTYRMRIIAIGPYGTFGQMTLDGVRIYTLQSSWTGHATAMGPLVPGHYRMERSTDIGTPSVWHVLDHLHDYDRPFAVGLHAKDSFGTILVGMRLSAAGDDWTLRRSVEAFDLLAEVSKANPSAILRVVPFTYGD